VRQFAFFKAPATALADFVNGVARKTLYRHLAELKQGRLALSDQSGETAFGASGDLRATVQVHSPAAYRRAVFGGTLALAESYLRGEWDCDDLVAALRIFARNRELTDRMESGLAAQAINSLRRLGYIRLANSQRGSRRNIGAHYDLGNDFFQLWLDETMAYSSGVFPAVEASLKEASQEKFDRICRKLDLRPSDEVIEIGAGWGGFALYAARRYGCRVTTTTISREQYDYAVRAIEQAGLADRITVLNRDYRELSGQFDKLVSIEMVEAVGHRYLDRYFRQCSNLLRPEGTMVIQAIVMPEQNYAAYLKTVDFIQTYVFPGGCLPSLGSMLKASGRVSDLKFLNAEDFAPHYAETLRRWRDRFHDRLDEVRELGYPERFIRLWNFYLCSCEAAFEERTIGVLQLQFDKPQRGRKLPGSAAAATKLPHRRHRAANAGSPLQLSESQTSG
jgi:cyclopropane-fatty-acyl-phospholipid synthase